MEYQRRSNGLATFLEHWWFLLVAIVALVTSQLLTFFTRLTGTRWIWCYAITLLVAAVGVSLIFYAKIPLYQQRRVARAQTPVLSLGLPLRHLRCCTALVFAIVETMRRRPKHALQRTT